MAVSRFSLRLDSSRTNPALIGAPLSQLPAHETGTAKSTWPLELLLDNSSFSRESLDGQEIKAQEEKESQSDCQRRKGETKTTCDEETVVNLEERSGEIRKPTDATAHRSHNGCPSEFIGCRYWRLTAT